MPGPNGWPLPENPTRYYKALSTATIALVGTISKFWMNCLTSVRIENGEILAKAVLNRDPKRSLVTTTNHHSCLDEPLLFAVDLPVVDFVIRQKMRWSLGADDVVFTTKKHQLFFGLGKTIPITRGAGVQQYSLDYTIDRLNQGDWIHIFPEGKINITKELMRLKWGVGRLIAEANLCPLVIPFYHLGMDCVLPNVTPYRPKICQKVSIYIGEPLIMDELIQRMKNENRSLQEIRKAVTDTIQNEFAKLKLKCEELHRQHLGDKALPPPDK